MLEISKFTKFLIKLAEVYPEYKKQKELAELTGIPQSEISRWKSQKKYNNILAKYINISLEGYGWQLKPDPKILFDILVTLQPHYLRNADTKTYDLALKLLGSQYLTDCINEAIKNNKMDYILSLYKILDLTGITSIYTDKRDAEYFKKLSDQLTKNKLLNDKINQFIDNILHAIFRKTSEKAKNPITNSAKNNTMFFMYILSFNSILEKHGENKLFELLLQLYEKAPYLNEEFLEEKTKEYNCTQKQFKAYFILSNLAGSTAFIQWIVFQFPRVMDEILQSSSTIQ